MKLTHKQKIALLKAVFSYSTKSMLESVDEVGEVYTEENYEELSEAIDSFLDHCHEILRDEVGKQT